MNKQRGMSLLRMSDPSQDARVIMSEQLGRVHDLLQSWTAADRYLFLAKINGVPARTIQQTLADSPFETRVALATVNTGSIACEGAW